ncbi:MAG: DUF4862 family protein [Propionibacteriaceae bacterium]|nr:DUF4862 family protein [Propionibacteriaceae bacterium]
MGGYAGQPPDPTLRQIYIEKVLAIPGVDGLEIPFGANAYQQDKSWLWDTLPSGSSSVLTMIPTALENLSGNPQWGLASGDPDGCKQALEWLAQACDTVARASAAGRRVVAIEIQTAPHGDVEPAPKVSAFRETLATVADWDWCGAELVVEHCDSIHHGRPWAKGFLSLEDEIKTIGELSGTTRTPLGITINWGRSVIDAHHTAGAVEQVQQAKQAGMLRGLMFSGVTDRDGRYGPAWEDSHPGAFSLDDELGEPASLLTLERIAEVMRVAGEDLVYDGVKIAMRPADTTDEHRLATLRYVLDAMADY